MILIILAITLLFSHIVAAQTRHQISVQTGSSANFILPSGVEVRITEVPYKKSKDSECKMNGRLVLFPSGAPLPKTYVKSIKINFKGRWYALDGSCMYDAWGGRPLEVPGFIRYFGGKCFDVMNCQFRGVFSDGVGTFAAEWRVVNGIPIRTVITASNDVIQLFIKNIDPPESE